MPSNDWAPSDEPGAQKISRRDDLITSRIAHSDGDLQKLIAYCEHLAAILAALDRQIVDWTRCERAA